MALLAGVAAALLLVTGCYSPDLRDCTVSCASSADCAGAQVCSSDHFCAASGMTCGHVSKPDDAAVDPSDGTPGAPPRDAAMPPHDAAAPIDAAIPIDAATEVALHLHVDGNGSLSFDAHSCTADCTYMVAIGVSITVLATPAPNQHLDKWTEGPCKGSHFLTCTFTPTVPVFAAVKFKGGD